MNTTNFLNIKKNNTDLITGQALGLLSVDNKKSELFKSAFNNEMDRSSTQSVRAQKSLPLNGKELPVKESSHIRNDKSPKTDKDKSNDTVAQEKNQRNKETDNKVNHHQEKDNEKSVKTESEQNTYVAREKHNDDPENSVRAEQNDSTDTSNQSEHSQDNTGAEQTADNTLLDSQHWLLAAEIDNADEQSNTSADLSLDELVSTDNQTLDPSLLVLQPMDEQQQLVDEQPNKAVYWTPNSLTADKNIASSVLKPQLESNKNLSEGAVKMPLYSGSEAKNESALSKSIADFQQFIDMSQKHSMAGDAIASVKSFEQKMNVEQLNAQLLINDAKSTLAQTGSTQTQTHSPVTMLDRANVSLAGSLQQLSQTAPSLEVKTTVGKAAWSQSFSNQIIMMANNAIQQAKIKLNPLKLGPVEAMLKLSGESAVVTLTSQHLSTKEALENAIPRLKEMLNENGFSQVDVNVSHQDKNTQQEANLGSNDEHGNSAMPGDEQLSEETLDSGTATQVVQSDELGLNIVDYYA